MKTTTKMQAREVFTAGAVSLREEQGGIIEGVAIVVNKETILYECADYREVEIIDPSCISEKFIKQQDIKLNLLHDRQTSIARTPNSLRVEPRADGLHFEADIPDCDLGRRARALVDNGTYTGCSFEFYPRDYEVTEREGADGKPEYLIRHTAFEKVTALTIAMDPAYPQTSVSAREIYRQRHTAIEPEKAPETADGTAAAIREYNHRKRQIQINRQSNH